MNWLIILLLVFTSDVQERTFIYNGSEVKTTFTAPEKFYGTYKGRKQGYLELKTDGTGIYHYDVFGFAPASCKRQPIAVQWGFLLNDKSEIVSFKREYGISYPLLLKSVSETKFQGCQTEILLDFIMEYKDGKLGVSSSDDWIKQ